MAQQPPTTVEGMLLLLRMMHVSLIAAIFLYPFALQLSPAQIREPLSPALVSLFAVLGVSAIVMGVYIRKKKIAPAFEKLRQISNDPAGLIEWRTGGIISAALAESVAVFGLFSYLLGGTMKQAAPFFAVGLMVMLVWWPRRP